VSQYTAIGTHRYDGVKLSFRRRAADSISLSGNYTLSRCRTDTPVSGKFIQFSEGYTDPNDPTYDRGNCPQNRRQIASVTMGYETPQFDNRALRAAASGWRASGIMSARSGDWLTVTTTQDLAGTGVTGQRVNQVNDDPYGDKTLTNYLDAAAFAFPAAGTLGNHRARSMEGPGFWTVDLALARLLSVGTRSDAGGPHRIVQSAQQLQLGQSVDEPRRGHVRPDYVAERQFTDHAVRGQVRLLINEDFL
jgi:hypothetical protein